MLTKATNDRGELILEKAFIESVKNEMLYKKLTKGLNNIIAWLLLSSGDQTGPVQKYAKIIESQCKFIIMVSSEVKDAQKIENVMRIYHLIMKNLKDLVDQGRIAIALAYNKTRSIHQGLSSIFKYFMVADEIAEDFVFRQNGLDMFLKLMLN